MKLIKSKVEIIPQSQGIQGVYTQIELAGRTCYKSEDKITNESANEFVDRMIKSKHNAMLEQGTIYLTIPHKDAEYFDTLYYSCNKYSIVNMKEVSTPNHFDYFITTNLRVLVEGDRLADLSYMTDPTEYHEKRITARFTCSRAIANEIVRHRVMSFAQESQRYCNYSKDKFGNEVRCIIPTWLEDTLTDQTSYDLKPLPNDAANFISALSTAETYYKELLNSGIKPQFARDVLPNATKTEIVVTGFESDWKHFFELRCAASAHPDIQKLAKDLYMQLYNKEYDIKTISQPDIPKNSVHSDNRNKERSDNNR